MASPSISDSEKEGLREDSSELGFPDGIMWTLSVYDGKEGMDGANTIADMEKMHIISTELEPDHFYSVTLFFVAEIDAATPEKYEDVHLQVRFPSVLFGDSVNAIGAAIHGKEITTDSNNFGITSQEDLTLYYIEDTAEIDCGDKATRLTPDGADVLFAGGKGVPLSEALGATKEIDGQECAIFKVEFLLYTALLDPDIAIYRGDSELTYWAGRQLMCDAKDSVAPSCCIPRVAAMGEDGTVHLPKATEEEKSGSGNDFAILMVVTIIFIIIIVIFVALKVRERAREEGITGFWNILTALMNNELADMGDDLPEDIGEVVGEIEEDPEKGPARSGTNKTDKEE